MDDIQSLIEMARQAGPFAAVVMTTLWWLERQERRETQKKHEENVEKSLTAMTAVEAALHSMSLMLGKRE